MSTWDETYMKIAEIIADRSYCENAKVGAILVKNNRIISIGYNGTPSGFDNTCEINGETKKEVLHAESNCISKCAKSVESSDGSVMYVTLSPCIECAKLIIQSGIKEVYFKKRYRNDDGLALLKQSKINYHEI